MIRRAQRTKSWVLVLALHLGGTATLPVAAQTNAGTRRQAVATRTEVPPTIDGRIIEDVWNSAVPIGELVQVDPLEGAPPSEATEVRILFDPDFLYIALRFSDRKADEIISSSRERDAFLDADDRFELLIDTFDDNRSAFWFQMNAAGSKSDALITQSGGNFNKPWDGIWEGKSTQDAEGWSVEMAIPYKTLNFKEGAVRWGFNVKRYIGRLREESRWASPDQDKRFFSVGDAGDLVGIENIRQGIGLDVVPFFVSSLTKDRTGGGDSDLLGEPGLDAFYKITPNLTLSLTVNTDFAETEVDERRINLTRFPLFFPERRDFFLQDAGLFDFAGPNTFFSRRIGLSRGEEVPILAGAKLTGRVDDYNIGILDVQTDDVDGVDGENLFAGRVSRNVGEQSSIGGIFTRGNPGSSLDNEVVGVDAQFFTTNFDDGKTLDASVWFLKSETEGVSGGDQAMGASVSYPNDLWGWNAGLSEIQENFNAALGFIPRTGIRQYFGGIQYEPRPNNWIRQFEFSVDTNITTDTDDVLETWTTKVQPLGITFESGEQIRIGYEHIHDELRDPFTISGGNTGDPADDVTVPIGEYDYDRVRLQLASARQHQLAVDLSVTGGTFFDGDRVDYRSTLNWRHSALFTGAVEWIQSDVDLDGGEFQTQVARMRARFSFSPRVSWNTFVQWDNLSKSIGVNSRVRWIPQPGREMFLVFNQTLDESGGGLVSQFQQLALKIAYTIRL